MSTVYGPELTRDAMLRNDLERGIEIFQRMNLVGSEVTLYRDSENPLRFQLAMETMRPKSLLLKIKTEAFPSLACSELTFDGSRYWARFLAT